MLIWPMVMLVTVLADFNYLTLMGLALVTAFSYWSKGHRENRIEKVALCKVDDSKAIRCLTLFKG
jgi:hypothetical protein